MLIHFKAQAWGTCTEAVGTERIRGGNIILISLLKSQLSAFSLGLFPSHSPSVEI